MGVYMYSIWFAYLSCTHHLPSRRSGVNDVIRLNYISLLWFPHQLNHASLNFPSIMYDSWSCMANENAFFIKFMKSSALLNQLTHTSFINITIIMTWTEGIIHLNYAGMNVWWMRWVMERFISHLNEIYRLMLVSESLRPSGCIYTMFILHFWASNPVTFLDQTESSAIQKMWKHWISSSFAHALFDVPQIYCEIVQNPNCSSCQDELGLCGFEVERLPKLKMMCLSVCVCVHL